MLVRRSYTLFRSNRGDLRTNRLSGVGIFATVTIEEREESILKTFLTTAGYSSGRLRLTLDVGARMRLLGRGLLDVPDTILFRGERLTVVKDRGHPHAIIPRRLVAEEGLERGQRVAAFFDMPPTAHRGPALQRLMRTTPRLKTLFNSGPYAGYWDGFPGEDESAEAEEPMPGVTAARVKRKPRWEVLVIRDGGNTTSHDEGAKRADGVVTKETEASTTFRVDHDELEASGKRYPAGVERTIRG